MAEQEIGHLVENGHYFRPAAELLVRVSPILAGAMLCARCGIVRRAGGKNSPCKGKVKVTLRNTPPEDGGNAVA